MQVKWFPCLVSLQVKVTWCQDACVPTGQSSFHRLRCRKWCHAWTGSEGHGSVLVFFSSLLVSEWGGNAAGGRRLEPRWRPAGMWTVSVLHQNLTLDSWTLIWKSNGLCVSVFAGWRGGGSSGTSLWKNTPTWSPGCDWPSRQSAPLTPPSLPTSPPRTSWGSLRWEVMKHTTNKISSVLKITVRMKVSVSSVHLFVLRGETLDLKQR